jgi:hypothetical protein
MQPGLARRSTEANVTRKKWCLDANAVAQEKGIEAVTAIVQYSGESSARRVLSD